MVSTKLPGDVEATTRPQLGASELPADRGLHICGATIGGALNALCDRPRQDAFGLFGGDPRWVVCGVADGVGSAELSHVGADRALAAALTTLGSVAGDDGEGPLAAVVTAADAAVVAAAEALEVPAHELATTLTVAGIERTAQADGARRCLIVSAGDSPALLLRESAEPWVELTPAPEGPANLVRCFLPGATADAVAFGCVLRPGEVLLLATDGLATPLRERANGLADGLRERWLPEPRPLVRFLVDLTFDGHYDDRSAVAVWNWTDR